MLFGYLDICIGILVSLEELNNKTVSDIYDGIITLILMPVTVALPIWCFLFIKKNISKIDEISFRRSYEPIVESLKYHYNYFSTINHCTSEYCFRKMLLAVIIVPLRFSPFMIIIGINQFVVILDFCYKLHFKPYAWFLLFVI